MPSVYLSDEQMEAVHSLIASTVNSSRVRLDPETRPLRDAAEKLAKVIMGRRCKHCGSEPARRSDGICDPCQAWKHIYGVLPPKHLLEKRQRRGVA